MNSGDQPFASGALADMYEGSLNGSKVCVGKVRIYSNGDPQKVRRVRPRSHFSQVATFKRILQMFCKEAVTWKHLRHRNMVPFIGATLDPLQLVSAWMPTGGLTEYVTAHPKSDRSGLVGFLKLPAAPSKFLTLFASYMMSLRAWPTSTPMM